jgi:hypothetical protein
VLALLDAMTEGLGHTPIDRNVKGGVLCQSLEDNDLSPDLLHEISKCFALSMPILLCYDDERQQNYQDPFRSKITSPNKQKN